MNAIAEAMHLLDEERESRRWFEPPAEEACERARHRDTVDVQDDADGEEPPPLAFDGERVLDWTVQRICACSLAEGAPEALQA